MSSHLFNFYGNVINIYALIFYPIAITNSLVLIFFSGFLGFCVYDIVLFSSGNSIYFNFFECPWLEPQSRVLNRSGAAIHVSLWSWWGSCEYIPIDYRVGCGILIDYIPFIRLKKPPSVSRLSVSAMTAGFSQMLLLCLKMTMCFLPLINTVYYIDFHMLNQPCTWGKSHLVTSMILCLCL